MHTAAAPESTITIRTRTLAVFAAGAVTMLIAIAAFVGTRAIAATTPNESLFVPVTPCRLFDTRPDFNVGNRDTPIGPAEEVDFRVTGSRGECTGIPSGATAVSINVTAVGATQPTDLRIWPASASNPGTSFMNPSNTSGTVVNKVDVGLSPSGSVTIFNAAGSVHVIGDVLGYYTDASASRPFAVSSDSVSVLDLRDTQIFNTVTVELDGPAQVFLTADASLYANTELLETCVDFGYCNVGIRILDDAGASVTASSAGGFERLHNDKPATNVSVSVVVSLPAGSHTFNLSFESATIPDGYMDSSRSTLTALVFPTS